MKNKRKRGASLIGWWHWVWSSFAVKYKSPNKMITGFLVKDYEEFHDTGMSALGIALIGIFLLTGGIISFLLINLVINNGTILWVSFIIFLLWCFWYPWYLLYRGLYDTSSTSDYRSDEPTIYTAESDDSEGDYSSFTGAAEENLRTNNYRSSTRIH